MYDTARRVALVKKRVRDNTRRRQRRSVYGLSAACMLLFAALVQAEGMAIERGQTAAQGAFGAMLLREDAGGYVLVGVRPSRQPSCWIPPLNWAPSAWRVPSSPGGSGGSDDRAVGLMSRSYPALQM